MSIDFTRYKTPSRRYFQRDTLTVAEDLLGAYVRHESPDGVTGGMIVETEGYLHTEPGCHAFNGETPRNKVMWGEPGYAYTYFTYGMYWMLNFVTEKPGCGCAVLIRAIEPVEGIELMRKRRPKAKKDVDLTNGPGKLAMAMGIGREQYGLDLLDSTLTVKIPSKSIKKRMLKEYGGVVQATRIGLAVGKGDELEYRFYIKEHPYVSVKAK